MQFAAVGGITLHYTLDGLTTGVPLVFIHSLGTDLRIWDDVLPHFADDFRTIAYDIRGHGISDCPSAPYSIQDHVDDLAGLLSQLQLDSVILVGISVGGMIAMAYAAAYPERVKALILCDTNTSIGTASMWNERIVTLRQRGMESLAEPILARWFSPSFAAQHSSEYRGYYNMLTRTPVIGYTATCAAIRDADLSEAAKKIKTKTLIVCGADDVSTPPEVCRVLSEVLADACFALVENSGHLSCIEQSDKFADSILNFLRESGYVRSKV